MKNHANKPCLLYVVIVALTVVILIQFFVIVFMLTLKTGCQGNGAAMKEVDNVSRKFLIQFLVVVSMIFSSFTSKKY